MACVKRSRRCKALASDSFLLLRQDGPKLSWSMDFVMAVLDSGRRIKRMICVDEVTKEYLTITPHIRDFMLSGHAFSGQHCTVSWLSGDDKNQSGHGIYLSHALSIVLSCA